VLRIEHALSMHWACIEPASSSSTPVFHHSTGVMSHDLFTSFLKSV
jgi:hypothetical protein